MRRTVLGEPIFWNLYYPSPDNMKYYFLFPAQILVCLMLNCLHHIEGLCFLHLIFGLVKFVFHKLHNGIMYILFYQLTFFSHDSCFIVMLEIKNNHVFWIIFSGE
jgi:hypothetical protein